MTNSAVDFRSINIAVYPHDDVGVYDWQNGIHYADNEIRELCEDIDALRCVIKGCKEREKIFASEVIFKKHLKELHNRAMCEVCLKHSAANRDEQKLFTPGALANHLNHGEFDENGNLVSYHPYCQVRTGPS